MKTTFNDFINEDFLVCTDGDLSGFKKEIQKKYNNKNLEKDDSSKVIFMISGDEETINKYKKIAKPFGVKCKFES